jgi:8-oxo-dGTP pyrophosphatase MutT (NUDIX family)
LARHQFLRPTLPLQVAAVCYRRRGPAIEFLLVNTNGGGKWTFPKGAPERSRSHSQTAEREAREEAGAHGHIESQQFHLYLHSKGVFWKAPGVREFVVKAFLMEVDGIEPGHEPERNPTWFSPERARRILAKGREIKYAREMQTLIDRALEQLGATKATISQAQARRWAESPGHSVVRLQPGPGGNHALLAKRDSARVVERPKGPGRGA